MADSTRAYEKIINFVEYEIMEGNYKIGDKLPPERELSQLLGASRNSVREGLCILERMGAISSYQGAGNYISDNFGNTLIEVMTLMYMLEEGTLQELNEFRYCMECQALNSAIRNITPKQIADLEMYLKMLEETPEEEKKAHYDKMIHYTIAEASGNRFIIDNLQALTVVMDRFIKDMRSKILSDNENKSGLMASHTEIVQALKKGDRRAARNALDIHFKYIEDYMDK